MTIGWEVPNGGLRMIKGQLIELPLAIELKDFHLSTNILQKLMLIDNETGSTLPEKSPVHVLLGRGSDE